MEADQEKELTEMDRYRVLITGCRRWRIDDLAEAIIRRLRDRHGDALLIVHGDATGVDAAFRRACERLNVEHEPHPAAWRKYGNRAGPLRNEEMVQAGADVCLAFHRSIATSKGTGGCARLAIQAVIPTWLVAEDRGPDTRPVRLEEV